MARFERGTWKDRVSTNPSRRSLTVFSSTGSSGLAQGDVITADVARADTDVSTVGTAFNSANMTDLENRIYNKFLSVKGVTELFLSANAWGKREDFVLPNNRKINDYNYIGVYYVAQSGQLSGYTEIHATDATELVCSISYPNSANTAFLIRSAYIEIPDYKTFVFRRNAFLTIHTDGSNNTISTDNAEKIGIRRILGYKL